MKAELVKGLMKTMPPALPGRSGREDASNKADATALAAVKAPRISCLRTEDEHCHHAHKE